MGSDKMETLKEAILNYGPAEYRVIAPGGFVRCAVTGKPIPLTQLSYWSVAHQEAYYDAAAAYTRYRVETERLSDSSSHHSNPKV